MSSYYKYNFVSPEPIYSIVVEELKSYFDTGAIDQIMFSTYLNKCLNKLGKATYTITEDMLYLENFQSRLPDNFYAVREAWLCTSIEGTSYQSGTSFYSQTSSTTIQIAPMVIGGSVCGNPACQDSACTCQPNIVQAVYKTNHQTARSYKKQYLLKPGTISAKRNCDVEYTTEWDMFESQVSFPTDTLSFGSSGYDSFDIRDNKFVTNFREGAVYLIFYATDYDNEGSQLVPDNYRIKEYIEKFLKFKCFETLCNQTNDETFNQLLQKKQEAKMEADEAFIMADIELKKETVHDKQRKIRQTLRRNQMYELPNRTERWGRRRYN